MKKVLNFRFELIPTAIVIVGSLVYLTYAVAEKNIHLWLLALLGMLGAAATYVLFRTIRRFLVKEF